MKNLDHKDRDPHGRESPRKTVRVLGMELQKGQLMIFVCAAVLLGLAARYGFFEYLSLGAVATVAVAAPLLAALLCVAFIPVRSGPTAPYEEDKRA